MATRQERDVYELFRLSVLLKGLISVVEVVSGIAVLFISPTLVQHLAQIVFGGELSEDPFDFLATQVLGAAAQYTIHTARFLAFYLFSRGLVKTGLVWALLKNQLWAYPVSIVVMFGFVGYQLYQIWSTHSLLVTLITAFDLIVIYFIWREWRIVERHHGKQVH